MRSSRNEGKKDRLIEGIIDVTSKGVGYVANPKFDQDIEIPHERLNTALNGDAVLVRLSPSRRAGRQQGEIIKVVERATWEFVGVLREVNGQWRLFPDDRRCYVQFVIPAKRARGAKENYKALVRLTKWKKAADDPEADIIELIGQKGVHETEMRAIVLSHGFATGFPEAVVRESEDLGKRRAIPEEEVLRRRDFRTVPTFTIDPSDAKDFDDAISVRTLPDGRFEIGVHIADVSHYVRPGSAMDKEARKRGTSVYLVDRTIPMLPEILSNDICSLLPGEDRLTFSAVFVLTREAVVKERWFGQTIIHSHKRFAYEEAQRVLDVGEGPLYEELSVFQKLGRRLKEARLKAGAIDFGQTEVKFKLDESGKPIAVVKKERLESMMLIEDFMLLANRAVAEYINTLPTKGGNPPLFVYRIHDVPDPERIEELSVFLRAIGYDLRHAQGLVKNEDILNLFSQIEGKPEEELIKIATIRSMAKAVYSTKNIGHFGLSFRYYTHFTSPIRRYPDVLVHRILKSHLHGEPLAEKESALYERLAIDSSEREIDAVEAERDSIKMKQVEYMKDKVGEVLDAAVSGVSQWGIFVEDSATKAEGLVRLRDMRNDYYVFEKQNYRVRGERTGVTYSLGQRVKVRLVRADLESRTLDFILV